MVTAFFRTIALWGIVVESFRVSFLDFLLVAAGWTRKQLKPKYHSACDFISDGLRAAQQDATARADIAWIMIGSIKLAVADKVANAIAATIAGWAGFFIVMSTDVPAADLLHHSPAQMFNLVLGMVLMLSAAGVVIWMCRRLPPESQHDS